MKSSIEQILADYKNGKMVILMDDEGRENEGDLLIAADRTTAKDINFMATFGKGLICLTLTEERCKRLKLPLMVRDNNNNHSTNFTISIEASRGVTTGVSAADRAITIHAATAKNAVADDIIQPGHIFPLMAQKGGVLTRAGHTEAGCDLARLTGFEPSSVIVEILNDDGSMARRNDIEIFAKKHNIRWGTVEDLISYRIGNEKTIQRTSEQEFISRYGNFTMINYIDNIYNQAHIALIKGDIQDITKVRVHMQNIDNDILGKQNNSLSVDSVLKYIAKNGGVFVLLKKHNHQVKDDNKTYGIGAQILADLGVSKMDIISKKAFTYTFNALSGFGLSINQYIEIQNEV